jgi:hypothetical protein
MAGTKKLEVALLNGIAFNEPKRIQKMLKEARDARISPAQRQREWLKRMMEDPRTVVKTRNGHT